ncbi:LysR family transcriptional regulator [Vibrio rumoiensis]|uniref:LysR family transcriptional regulator n=1 Tax=Vibrio rumoiensis 1S-45 TaxID=1188252 RepID=A0A1E5E5D1_9VIBR|nr:LysR family transcriptional regulator [Vibrio rumoiensis]OEF28105.1 LysR family transcriptional regulator [Vibrio rumoiensis 1S-45]
MDIDALRSFLAFVETGSFTRAAKQICRTQSAFSAQMKKLEEETGAGLFEKDGRNLILSEAGLQLSGQAKQLITLHDNTLNQLKQNQGKRSLRLGCPEDYNDIILPIIVSIIKEADPRCSIHIYSETSMTLRKWLDEGKIDAAILTRQPNSEEGYWLTCDQGVWIAAPSYQIPKYEPLPLALFQTDCKYHAAAIDGLTKRGVNFQLLACCNTASAQRALVKHGLAVGAMGRLSVGDGLRIIEDMPSLPNVDIVLSVSAKVHPLLNSGFLQNLEASFKKKMTMVSQTRKTKEYSY